MKKCAFILPYYGKFNNYFSLFLKSCGNNPDFDWFIFTDDKTQYLYPQNVHVFYHTFDWQREMIQAKFKFKLSLDYPYKLCDFKPAYGYIFHEYIKEYKSWGYCDCDLIFGKLNNFISDRMIEEYDKLFTMGHMTIFKNDEKNICAFQSQCRGMNYFEKVFSSSQIFAFDELMINDIYINNGYSLYSNDISANISVYYYKFHLTKRQFDINRYLTESYDPSVYLLIDGKIKRYLYSEDDGSFRENEFAYLHLQQRKMKIEKSMNRDGVIQILPNIMCAFNYDDIQESFYETCKYKFNFRGVMKCWGNRIRWKVKRILSCLLKKQYTRNKQ